MTVALLPEDEAVIAAMERWHVPGVTAAAFEDPGGSSGAWGVAAGTIFEAASMGKAVAAYATLALVAAGVLELDVPLVRYSRALAPDDPRTRVVTARMCLSHRTGLWCDDNPGPLYFEKDPGGDFKYSNAGFNFLQAVIEDVTGETFDVLGARLVLEPLGMNDSSWVWRPDYEARTAVPHDDDGAVLEEKWRPAAAWAPGSLHTTAEDYARFMRALASREGPVPSLLVDEMLRPQVEVHEAWGGGAPDPGSSWGLGIGLQPDSFWHWGWNNGFLSFATTWPEEGVGVAVMTDATKGLWVCKEIVRLVSGRDHPAFRWLEH